MNRGIARRPIFETREDVRYFLSRVALAVRRGEIEVHAFCVMATHFHLLVRSPTGQLSEAMRRIQNAYVRYFNRKRHRDGPLFRGRFVSCLVGSLFYRTLVVPYIDYNPVQARIVGAPWDYPYGSASLYVSNRVPKWLSTTWIDSRMQPYGGQAVDYKSAWGREPTVAERALVEARLRARSLDDDPLDDLVGAAPARVREWMVRKSLLADRTRPGIVCVPREVVLEVVTTLKARGRRWRHETPKGQDRDAWEIATVGLLRGLAGLTHVQIAAALRTSSSITTKRLRRHKELTENPSYATRLGRVAALCIGRAFPNARSA
jgi:REP element-mobilizing transposase RayT